MKRMSVRESLLLYKNVIYEKKLIRYYFNYKNNFCSR